MIALLIALAGTLLGSGVPENALAGYDATAWLWSSPKGELARVNGMTGRIDTRYKIVDGQGRTMLVAQTDRYVIMRDLATGKISVIDLASLQVAATSETTPGVGITVALHDDVAFIIDGVQGIVRQLNPGSLGPVGQPLRFPPGLVGGAFDQDGRLWVLIPSEGTVAAVVPAPATGGDPRIAHSAVVAEPAHDLAISVLDHGAAVLDNTAGSLTVATTAETRTVRVNLAGPGVVPPRTAGTEVPVTVAADRRVFVINTAPKGDRSQPTVADYAIPGDGSRPAACVAWSGRIYCPDDATGTVQVLDIAGKTDDPILVPNSGGPLELEVREGFLFINAPGSSTARVVDDQHRVKVVDKYANNVPGGDPPPTPPAPPPPKPVLDRPSAPGKVTAVAGNAQARVSWTAAAPNGAPILKYVIEGGPKPVEVGANQRALDITGLTNGTEYRFSVYAVNSKGNGPKRAANPVIPTAEVPDAPISVNAEARPDGTVAVSWPEANGQGRKVVRYEVTAITKGAPEPAGDSTAPSLTIAAGKLAYGTQYAFTVVAVNDRGASSVASPVSPTVTPYNRPGAPGNVRATTVNKRGAIDVSWAAAEANGRAIDHYVVSAGNQRQEVRGTSVSLTGFGDGATVQVSVLAVNAAGDGPSVTRTARTIDLPKLSVTGSSAGLNSITVNFTVQDGGSPATCSLSINGGGQANGNCTSLTAGNIWPGRSYSWTLTVTNAAGSATGNGSLSTRALTGTVICEDASYCGHGASGGGIGIYATPHQNIGHAIGDVYAPDQYEAVCQAVDNQGTSINATPWGGKRSNMWVRIKYPAGKENYIPFAWIRLAEGDNLGLLPGC